MTVKVKKVTERSSNFKLDTFDIKFSLEFNGDLLFDLNGNDRDNFELAKGSRNVQQATDLMKLRHALRIILVCVLVQNP